MSRSFRPLRSIVLVGGDRFTAECLDWTAEDVTFRLRNGRTLRIPVGTIATLDNPPGETDVLVESFERVSQMPLDTVTSRMLDETHSADGRRSLRIDASASGQSFPFAMPLSSARIEFSFRIGGDVPRSRCGTCELEWGDGKISSPPLSIMFETGGQLSITGIPVRSQSLVPAFSVADGWHSFVALVATDQTRLIVDDSIVASFPTPRAAIQSIGFQPPQAGSTGVLWIDELQVRRMVDTARRPLPRDESQDSDVVRLSTGDEIFGRLVGIDRAGVTLEALHERQSLPWNRVAGFSLRQPSMPVLQIEVPATGVVSSIELQSFADRPDCEPDRWTGTVIRTEFDRLIVQHELLGELTIGWNEIRRIDPQLFGQSLLVDARRYHLGNSIRPDFHRHRPDGTTYRGTFQLSEIPRGRPMVLLDVAELEAASPDAPPASPFLAELRAGHLVTEVFVNDHRVGDLNSLVRFKTTCQNPDRISLTLNRAWLKTGENSIQVRQQPLQQSSREFDDCEIGNLRLVFEATDSHAVPFTPSQRQ